MRRIHVSDILLTTVNMDSTYTVSNDLDSTNNSSRVIHHDETNNYLNNNNNKHGMTNRRIKSKRRCHSEVLFILSCSLVIGIVCTSSYLFGPLILKSVFRSQIFNASAVQVKHYRLRLMLNSTEGFYIARASMSFDNSQQMKELHLKCDGFTFTSIQLTKRKYATIFENFTTGIRYHVGTPIKINITSTGYTKNNEVFIIRLENYLEIGPYMLDMHYKTSMNTSGIVDLRTKGTYPITILKNTRSSFPNLGEAKFEFDLSVMRKTGLKCIGNVELKETEPAKNYDGYVWDHFKTTPPIYPNLIGLIVGKYKSVSIKDNNKLGILINIYSTEVKEAGLTYAKRITPEIFAYFKHYFNFNYPFTKLDVVLVDNETTVSKPGLISLSSESLLLDIEDNNLENQRQIFAAIAESLALQWIENKMKANQELAAGLARYLALEAEINLNDQEYWMTEEFFALQKFQSTDTTSKLTNVLFMIRNTISFEYMKMGINQFITTGNFQLLWNNTNATGIQFLFNWLNKPLYPIVTATRTTGWNVLLEQHSIDQSSNDVFKIPLTYFSEASNDIKRYTLISMYVEKNLFVMPQNWFIFNYHQIGYYRVNYQLSNWNQLISQLNMEPTLIPSLNRAQLISDSFKLAELNLLSYDVPFKLINQYLFTAGAKERNLIPWVAALNTLNEYSPIYLDSTFYGLFRKYKIQLLNDLWIKRHNLDSRLFNLVATELCELQHNECVQAALEIYDANKHRKDVTISQWVYCASVAYGNEEEFDFLLNKVFTLENQRNIHELLYALSCTKVAWKSTSLLRFSLELHINQAKRIWSAMAETSLGRLTGLAFIETNWPYNSNSEHESYQEYLSDEMIKIITDHFLSKLSTEADFYKIQKFYGQVPDYLNKTFQSALAKVSKRVEWAQKHYFKFNQYMSNTLDNI